MAWHKVLTSWKGKNLKACDIPIPTFPSLLSSLLKTVDSDKNLVKNNLISDFNVTVIFPFSAEKDLENCFEYSSVVTEINDSLV